MAFCHLISSFAVADDRVSGRDRVIRVSPAQSLYPVAQFMDLLEDPGGGLTWADVHRAPLRERFEQVHSETLNFGLTSSAFWLRFRVQEEVAEARDGPVPEVWLFDPGFAFPDRARWRLYDAGNGAVLAAGGFSGDDDRVFHLGTSTSLRAYYLRIRSNTALILDPKILTGPACLSLANRRMILFGIFYGLLIAVAAYNLFLYVSLCDKSYLWYVLYLLVSILYFLGINGLTGQYFLHGRPELVGMLSRSFIWLMTVFITLLARSFLMTPVKMPKIDKVILSFFAAAVLLTILNLFLPARMVNVLLSIMGLAVPSTLCVAGVVALTAGFRPARLFFLAWGLSILGVLAFALTAWGVLPYTVWGFHGFQSGTAAAAILLSFALGSRVKELRQERAALKKSMERVTTILDSMESGVFLVDSKTGLIQEVNQQAERMMGAPRQDIIGKPCQDHISSARHKPCPIADESLSIHRNEEMLITAAGHELPVLKRAKSMNLDGHDMILESFVDISDLKRAEEAMRQSEAKYRSLFESSRDAVMILDRLGYIDCNPATLHIFGCTERDEFIDKHPSDFSPPHQPSGLDSRTAISLHIEEAYEKGSRSFEWIHCRLNGEEFPAEVMFSTVTMGRETVIQALVRDITRKKTMENELIRLASTDPLTGADNRRSFLEKAHHEMLHSRRYDRPLSFLMIDVDHFKRINDTHGHHIGDQMLKALVATCKDTLRGTDLFGRVGGEEFAVLLPETDIGQAVGTAQRLQRDLSDTRIQTESGPVSVTVSIGLAVLEETDESLEQLMTRADTALYQAKDTGRNRLVRA